MSGFEVHDGVVGDLFVFVVSDRVVEVRDLPDADAVSVDVHSTPQPQQDVPQHVGEVVRRPSFE